MATSIDDVLVEMIAWSDATFPTQTLRGLAAHLEREAKELRESQDLRGRPAAGEIADVAMLIAVIANRCGINLADAVRDKLAECRDREWLDADDEGVIEHDRGET